MTTGLQGYRADGTTELPVQSQKMILRWKPNQVISIFFAVSALLQFPLAYSHPQPYRLKPESHTSSSRSLPCYVVCLSPRSLLPCLCQDTNNHLESISNQIIPRDSTGQSRMQKGRSQGIDIKKSRQIQMLREIQKIKNITARSRQKRFSMGNLQNNPHFHNPITREISNNYLNNSAMGDLMMMIKHAKKQIELYLINCKMPIEFSFEDWVNRTRHLYLIYDNWIENTTYLFKTFGQWVNNTEVLNVLCDQWMKNSEHFYPEFNQWMIFTNHFYSVLSEWIVTTIELNFGGDVWQTKHHSSPFVVWVNETDELFSDIDGWRGQTGDLYQGCRISGIESGDLYLTFITWINQTETLYQDFNKWVKTSKLIYLFIKEMESNTATTATPKASTLTPAINSTTSKSSATIMPKTVAPAANSTNTKTTTTTTPTTQDPLDQFCKDACRKGTGGSACNCADHPIG